MDKQFTSINGIEIAYLEQNGDSKYGSIFFIHGNSVSSRTWRNQLNDSLFNNYRLIAIDLPAHGNSAAAPDPNDTYTLPALADLMAKAVQQLSNNQPYILAGVSLSTNIIAEMLSFGIAPKGLIMAGPCIVGKSIPVESIIKPGTHVNVVFTDDPDLTEVESYGKETSLSNDEKDLQLFLEDFKTVKSPFRSTLAQSIGAKQYSDEILLLKTKNTPLLVVFGAHEKVVDCDYLDDAPLPLWRDRIFKIPGASHLVQIDQPAAFNKLMKEFVRDCFK